MDRRTDVTKLIIAFRNFANAPKRAQKILQCVGRSDLHLIEHDKSLIMRLYTNEIALKST